MHSELQYVPHFTLFSALHLTLHVLYTLHCIARYSGLRTKLRNELCAVLGIVI